MLTSKKPLKAVLIIGPESRQQATREALENSEIKSIYSQEGYLIIGDGNKKSVSKEKILSALKGNIGPDTRIDILVHGLPSEDDKKILGLDMGWEDGNNVETLFELLKEASSNQPLNVHVRSCFSGLANKSLLSLPEGSLLFTHVDQRFPAFIALGIISLTESIEKWSMNQLPGDGVATKNFLQSFLNSLASESFEGSSVATWKTAESGPKEYRLDIVPELKEVLEDPLLVLNKVANDYIQFCRDAFDISLDLPDLSLSAESYRKGYLIHHCARGDEDQVIHSLKQVELSEAFFSQHLNHLSFLTAATLSNKGKLIKFLLEKNVKANLSDLICRFIEYGALDIVKILYESGANLNEKSAAYNFYPLEVAVILGQKDTLEFLLANGATLDCEKIKVFYYAVRHPDVLKILLDFQNPEEQYKEYGFSLLHKAVLTKDHGTMKKLLKDGTIDVDQVDKLQTTPLSVALITEDKESIKLLLEYGANPHVSITNGASPWHAVVLEGRKDMVELLISASRIGQLNIDQLNDDGQTALYIASNLGYEEIVALLLSKGANPNISDKGGNTSLHSAALNGDKNIVKLIVSCIGIEINEASGCGYTPLHIASSEGHKDVVEILINAGADIHKFNALKQTPLYIAARNGYLDVVELLLQGGAQIDCRDYMQETPLYAAACYGKQVEVVKFLLQSGADPLIQIHGRSIIDALKENKANLANVQEVIQLIEDAIDIKMSNHEVNLAYAGAKKGDEASILKIETNPNKVNDLGFTALHLAAKEGNYDMINLLLGLKVDSNIRDNKSNTSLDLAITHNHQEVVELLIPHTSLNEESFCYKSPLYKAAKMGRNDIVILLINAGADIHQQSFGSMALHIAAKKGHKNVVQTFLDAGAEIDVKDGVGETPLYLAACYGTHVGVVKLLLEKGANPKIKSKDQGFGPDISILEYLEKYSSSSIFDRHSIIELVTKAIEQWDSKESQEPGTAFENIEDAIGDKVDIYSLSHNGLHALENNDKAVDYELSVLGVTS